MKPSARLVTFNTEDEFLRQAPTIKISPPKPKKKRNISESMVEEQKRTLKAVVGLNQQMEAIVDKNKKILV